jgi:DNA ligase-1
MFKPLLAPNDDPLRNPKFFDLLKYPLMVSPKLDGIRAVMRKDICSSRTNKELPNINLGEFAFNLRGLDGEFIAGEVTDHDVYNRTQSVIMSINKPTDDITYYVFDVADPEFANTPFKTRIQIAERDVRAANLKHPGLKVEFVEHSLVETYEELIAYEEEMLEKGFEGIMLRDPEGVYKHGRSTMLQGHLIKLKRFQDDEAEVIGFIEQQTNNNPIFVNEVGGSSRSTKKDGLTPAGTLGKLIVSYNDMDLEVSCGTLSHADRKVIWKNQDAFLGQHITFRHFLHGAKDKPRFPRFVGWRNMEHM